MYRCSRPAGSRGGGWGTRSAPPPGGGGGVVGGGGAAQIRLAQHLGNRRYGQRCAPFSSIIHQQVGGNSGLHGGLYQAHQVSPEARGRLPNSVVRRERAHPLTACPARPKPPPCQDEWGGECGRLV